MRYIDIKATVVPSPDGDVYMCCGTAYSFTGDLSQHLLDRHAQDRFAHPEGAVSPPVFLEALSE